MSLIEPNLQGNLGQQVRRVVIRNREGMVTHDWRTGFFANVRVKKGTGTKVQIEYEGFRSPQTYIPSSSESVQIFER